MKRLGKIRTGKERKRWKKDITAKNYITVRNKERTEILSEKEKKMWMKQKARERKAMISPPPQLPPPVWVGTSE